MEPDSPVIIHTAQIQRSQLVFNMAPISSKNVLPPPAEFGLALASSRASRNWRDSGRTARTMAAAREKPAPIKKRERQPYGLYWTTVRLMTAARR
jgi:hypothetical protein